MREWRRGVKRIFDDQTKSPLDPRLKEELCSFLATLCDGELPSDDWRRLNQILNEDSAARRYYLRYIAVHSGLTMSAAGPLGYSAVETQLMIERMTLERFAGHTDFAVTCGLEPSKSDRFARRRDMIRWAASLATIVLVVGAVSSLMQSARRHDERIEAFVAEDSVNVSDEASGPQQLVAEVTYVSDSAVWRNPNGSLALASRVSAGQSLTLVRGQVELTYTSGAKLLLTGPSEFLVESAGGKLGLGELVASVPKAGHGFTIETPHGKVVDLGTEFGVVVDDFGVSQVSVFEGKVETLPTGNAGVARDKIELTTGRAIQWTDNSIIPIEVQGGRYRRPGADVATSGSNRSVRAAMDEHFRGKFLDPANWKAFGEVVQTDHGPRLGNVAGAQQRPYLVTAQEFDPSYGAVTVVCDMRFENVQDVEHTSFAILTRSADLLSKPGTPWQDMLARCLRCRLKSDSHSGEGMLEAGTKNEADRELTNISWGGFSRPLPDTLYRLEMRDDGLNVSFTVSQVDNPSVRKTINCRSLFRGNQNFVALEGSSSGTTVIERLTISQEGPAIDDRSEFAASSVVRNMESPLNDEDSVRQRNDLVPPAARLLLNDDFGDPVLNSRIWMTLGDVVLAGGQLQLGLHNPEQHIDTWQDRPYLLTREQFDPAEGTLTIVGNATFAENFLQGYGGSFAVMTRADNAYGGGSGWEKSILRQGLRYNFWPAAFGFYHSLEIHEKRAPSTISLLIDKDFRINPRARSYLFQVIDDGKSATLTLIDAGDSNIRETILHPTISRSLSRGHIGFESCWGSPILLDNIRVYKSKNKSPDQASNDE